MSHPQYTTHPKGQLILISAPSGGGKNSVIRALLDRYTNAVQLVTTTTRDMRDGEQDGVDYHFLSREVFEKKLVAGDFIEHNEYAGNLYGTQWEHLNKAVENYPLVLSQAEVNGKHNLDKQDVPHVSIFLLPESLEALRRRIEKRGGISPRIIDERLEIAKQEIGASDDYDLAIVNKDGEFDKTVDEIAVFLEKKLGMSLS